MNPPSWLLGLIGTSDMAHHTRSNQSRRSLLVLLLFGDLLVCLTGLSLAYWIRYESSLKEFGLDVPNASYAIYLPLIWLGALFFVGSFAVLSVYDSTLLLRPQRSLTIITRGVFFWVLAFLGVSLTLKFEPSISRLFVLFASATTLLLLVGWRLMFYEILSRSRTRDELAQSVAILGWSHDAAKLVEAIHTDRNHPYDTVGYISTTPEPAGSAAIPLLGQADELEGILQRTRPDLLVVADMDLNRDELVRVASLCERHYVAFKVIPSFFQIFVSGLRLQSISGISILGIEALPLDSVPNQLLKRTIDIMGAFVGLVGAAPLMAILACLIRRDGPGPIFFYQERIGYRGRPFRMYKLRSMVDGAHHKDNESQSTLRQDPRVTRVGSFMRRWNLDELPQFWNVLKGDMSLIGPRPERSYHVEQLSKQIPHYNPRHSVRPGLSGWAQVNGLRGDTSLVDRIKYDLYYIENWSIWFDVQILVLTFVRRKNAY